MDEVKQDPKKTASSVSDSLNEAIDPVANQHQNRRRNYKRKIANLKCMFCESGIKTVMYKDIYHLQKATSVRGKIIGAEKSGVCRKHQRQLTRAIKRARYMALLPYVVKDE